ncbi:hypothetical protein CapIbe_002571 [Capra ibex]
MLARGLRRDCLEKLKTGNFPTVKKKSLELKSEETIKDSVEEDGKVEGFRGSRIYTLANLSHGSYKLITMSTPDSGILRRHNHSVHNTHHGGKNKVQFEEQWRKKIESLRQGEEHCKCMAIYVVEA